MAPPLPQLLSSLAAWPAGLGAARAARRATQDWADDPVLRRYRSPGGAAAAVAGPDGSEVLAALARRAADPWAATAALVGLVPRIAPIAVRWRRSGVPASDIDGMVADLVAEVFEVLRSTTPADPDRVVQLAWGRVSSRRRTQRARAARDAPLSDVPAARPGRTAVEEVLCELSVAAASGTLSRAGAHAVAARAAGWSTAELASSTGTDPVAIRARRSRAVRTLAEAGR